MIVKMEVDNGQYHGDFMDILHLKTELVKNIHYIL